MSLKNEEKGVVNGSGNGNPLGFGEADIALLDAQVQIPQTDAGYKAIYRFANQVDLVVMVLSSLSAAAAGTSLPLMTVCFSRAKLLPRGTAPILIVAYLRSFSAR